LSPDTEAFGDRGILFYGIEPSALDETGTPKDAVPTFLGTLAAGERVWPIRVHLPAFEVQKEIDEQKIAVIVAVLDTDSNGFLSPGDFPSDAIRLDEVESRSALLGSPKSPLLANGGRADPNEEEPLDPFPTTERPISQGCLGRG